MSFPHEIRLVLFMFYMMEAVAHMVLMRFNVTGFYVVYKNPLPLLLELPYFCYLGCVYIFGVLNLLAGVNICTSEHPSILGEVLRSLISCFVYVICSMLMLFDAESDLNDIIATKKPNDLIPLEEVLHPYFKYNHLESQGMASMEDTEYNLGSMVPYWIQNDQSV
ncbi:uncharacterized protein LOC110177259 [Drosophila serrata]|uniref:uncharacterized protein LOC110177259 n=1 Tax=Drosophila serrata TaxID=7274 RepID=UPI000A1D1058|nr:uncharacterized protein LOC110177259 [Drosophila serrata]